MICLEVLGIQCRVTTAVYLMMVISNWFLILASWKRALGEVVQKVVQEGLSEWALYCHNNHCNFSDGFNVKLIN